METHKEARDVVSYYQQNPAVLHGKQITLYLSKELMVIQVILECPYSSIFISFACIDLLCRLKYLKSLGCVSIFADR